MQWVGRAGYCLCAYCCLVTFISACVTPDLKNTSHKKAPTSLLCSNTTFEKFLDAFVCVCVYSICVLKKRNGCSIIANQTLLRLRERDTVESSEGGKSPVLTFEKAATHSNNPPGWGWRMGGGGGGQEGG